ncbi:periplasmic protein [Gimesia panareensis]|uniref:Periplasmic protein n=1 Tax=Gimesia panareensis TaxID=2527978 RepID=A0A517QA98_9PLAN|nr:BON domain-containing protein [Gimesia panareensis]QDT28556.1 periplasmic protein [Gimesia panareensis]
MNESIPTPPATERPEFATADEIIKRLVVDELYWDERVDAAKVKVVVQKGVVSLTGEVPTTADFYAAEADARMIEGVVTVENQIQVLHPTLVPDKELSTNAETVLVWSPEVDHSQITVAAKCGWITLIGCVPTCQQKQLAAELVESIPGVIGITNELSVVPTNGVSDNNIAREILKGIEHHRDLNTESIDVEVADGVVTLEGTVPHWLAYRTVEELALITEGVVNVKNHLIFNGNHQPDHTT